MNEEELKKRTKQFALQVIWLVEKLPQKRAAQIISSQLLRSATSVAANYRAACRARSTADFVNKMGLVEEEADESRFWLELVIEANLLPAASLQNLVREADELTAIAASSRKTARSKAQANQQ